MQKYLFRNIRVVNEGKIETKDVLVKDGRIELIADQLSVNGIYEELNGEGKYLVPGAIDDQVHFREPGLTHKGDISSESRAAVAGGVTSFMEMPNTIPNALTVNLLEEKYAIAERNAVANYSFFMGVSNNNTDEVLKAAEQKQTICGLKIFMGSSTGNMLVDNPSTLNRVFSEANMLIATHCEDEQIIKRNYEALKLVKPVLEAGDHPVIRNDEACFESSLTAIQLAKKYDSRLHILHISTAKELQLFSNMLPLKEKRITAEVCVHHLSFTDADYLTLGYKIKCNPAIKTAADQAALWEALNDNRLDVIATDHAPHLLAEKEGPYEHAHAGLPLVQHPVLLMLQHYDSGRITLEKIVEKMSHSVADCFNVKDRGYIREGYYADLVVLNPQLPQEVSKQNILYKCGWSPLEGKQFKWGIEQTMVNGNIVYANGMVNDSHRGKRLMFNR